MLRFNLASRKAVDVGVLPGYEGSVSWGEPGKTILLHRAVNGIVNLWEYNIAGKSYTQLTAGTGPDYFPMKDPAGKGVFFINGKRSGYLSVYDTRTKTSSDLVSDLAVQPTISPNGKRVAYVTIPEHGRSELWVSELDSSNKNRLATWTSTLNVGDWSEDGSQLTFTKSKEDSDENFAINADGSHLRALPRSLGNTESMAWSHNRKDLFLSGFQSMNDISVVQTWRMNVDGTSPESYVSGCGFAMDSSVDGKYMLASMMYGEKPAIMQFSTIDKTCTTLVPDVITFLPRFSSDGKSILYTISTRGEVSVYRIPWKDGNVGGESKLVLKLPFAFPQRYAGNAYDIAHDLSRIVYVRPGGQFDLYLLSPK